MLYKTLKERKKETTRGAGGGKACEGDGNEQIWYRKPGNMSLKPSCG